MSKALRSMTDRERIKAIQRRISNATKQNGNLEISKIGLGFWAAMDAKKIQRS